MRELGVFARFLECMGLLFGMIAAANVIAHVDYRETFVISIVSFAISSVFRLIVSYTA